MPLYINGDWQRDDCPLLEPANPCDATIGNEFPESDASLEITGLHFAAELERIHN